MNMSLFEVTGPVMVGPSSSHTAGAARLALVAKCIAGRPFKHVSFGLHGSFAKTYKGHGTDKALLAGAMGLREDDERLANSFEMAREQGLEYEFYETELDGMHENSVKITFTLDDGKICVVTGSSIGGGQIVIRGIDGFDVELDASLPTLLISQWDQKGIVSEVTRILAEGGLNIGVMKLSRKTKGDVAICIIEMDDAIGASIVEQVQAVNNVLSVRVVNGIGLEE